LSAPACSSDKVADVPVSSKQSLRGLLNFATLCKSFYLS
jgi:hypothetical protein